MKHWHIRKSQTKRKHFTDEVPAVPGVSEGPSEDWAGETDKLCPHVWGDTPARWPSPGPCPAPLLFWSLLQTLAGGSPSEHCLQNAQDRDYVRGLLSPIKAETPPYGQDDTFAQIYNVNYQQITSKAELKVSLFQEIVPITIAAQILLTKNRRPVFCHQFGGRTLQGNVCESRETSDLGPNSLHGLRVSEQKAQEPKDGRSSVALKKHQTQLKMLVGRQNGFLGHK